MRRCGPKHGARQRQQTLAYNPDSGKPLSASAYFPPDVARKLAWVVPRLRDRYDSDSSDTLQVSVKFRADAGAKAWRAAAAANLSLSGLLAELVRRMPVNDAGLPSWVEGQVTGQLPLHVAGSTRPSVNGLLRELVERMQVDRDHCPVWAPQRTLQMSATNASAA